MFLSTSVHFSVTKSVFDISPQALQLVIPFRLLILQSGSTFANHYLTPADSYDRVTLRHYSLPASTKEMTLDSVRQVTIMTLTQDLPVQSQALY